MRQSEPTQDNASRCDSASLHHTQRVLGDTAVLVDGSVRAAPLTGVTDLVPAFGVTAVHFDPAVTSFDAVAEWLNSQATSDEPSQAGRTVEIPVAYGGDFGSDLAEIAERSGLSADEVVQRHAGAEYTVGAVGFQPGFGYLEGLPAELHTPRRGTPRTSVPAGSVGIGGPYTGVYPSDSPGGWNLLGRTPLRVWDEHRQEPSLLGPGDRVRFRPIDAAEYERLATENQPTLAPAEPAIDRPVFRVLSAGVQTTLQDLGRPGRQHLGLSPGGAMDPTSLRLANLLVGNEPSARALESTLVGPVLECLEPITVGVSGAVSTAAPRRLARGERLDLRRLVGGARAYVACPGGFAGSTSKPLAEGDLLGSLDHSAVERSTIESPMRGSLPTAAWIRGDAPTVLRVLPGPQADRFGAADWERFLVEPYRVSPQSNRMGIHCEGYKLTSRDSEGLPSQPVCHGAIQVPPDGQPIVLGADRQTLGGYPVIAVVVSCDWPRLGQLRPGDEVRFAKTDLPTAQARRRRAERDPAMARVGLSLMR